VIGVVDVERKYRLGIDLIDKDSLLDGITFEEVIDVLHCNESVINETVVRRVVNDMLRENTTNMRELLNNNVMEIIKRAT
jgi:hypothetical protein